MSEFRLIRELDVITAQAAQTLLKQTYWAEKRPLEIIQRSMEHSMCYGVFSDKEKRLVGFARVLTDYATTYYISDVIVDGAYRGMGVGRMLMDSIESTPEIAGLRGVLATRDAQGLYAKYGFIPGDTALMQKPPKR